MSAIGLAVTVFLQGADGLILAVSRKDNHNDFGMPGGKVEADETCEEAAARELHEETGLQISNLKIIYHDVCKASKPDGKSFNVITYTGDVAGEIVQYPNEGIVKWITQDQFLTGSFSEYNKRLLSFLVQNS